MRWWPISTLVLLGLVIGPSTTWAQVQLDDNDALRVSLSHLQAEAQKWGIRSPNEEFRLRQVLRDELEQIHVRLDQVHRGIPVWGEQLIVHLNGDGSLRWITGNYRDGITISTQPRLSAQEARRIAQGLFPGPLTGIPKTELLVYPRDGEVVLAYLVVLRDAETPRQILVFVDAVTGKLVHSYSDLSYFAV